MQRVEHALIESDHSDPQYDELIVDCNTLSVDIENKIFMLHNFIRDKYRLKYPELESLVHRSIDYARVVKKIGNAMDITLVDLQGLLPSAIIMVVCVTASTTNGKPLPQDVLHKTMEACERAFSLDSFKKKVIEFVESRMRFIAPNFSAVAGSEVAAKLVATAGGLTSLANIPSDNIQLLGAKKNANNLAGFAAGKFHHIGGCYIDLTEIIQSTPPSLRKQVYELVADKSILAVRMDSAGGDPTGQYGTSLRENILKKIENLQELLSAKQPNPLPVPTDSHAYKRKRGNERRRKMKKRYEITERMKLANKIKFGVAEENSLGDGLGVGYGMLGQAAGIGKLLLSVVKKKFKSSSTSTRASSGLTSSLAFTPIQGIELSNPDQFKHVLKYIPRTAHKSSIKAAYGEWLMTEYSLHYSQDIKKKGYVICKIKKKKENDSDKQKGVANDDQNMSDIEEYIDSILKEEDLNHDLAVNSKHELALAGSIDLDAIDFVL
ncbi:putative aldehyde dehydrogenase family 2 member B7, mitochondrial-like [Capsicum annuum]|nr:putative aldehyde dehydrogenase family 2 member B7, mitochondrial-like [Capsicum annuum]